MGIAMDEEQPLTAILSDSELSNGSNNRPQLLLQREESLSYEEEQQALSSKKKKQQQAAQHTEITIDLERSESSISSGGGGAGGGGAEDAFLDEELDKEGGGDSDASLKSCLLGFVTNLRDDIIDYLTLLRTNRSFRFFLVSYIFGHMGEWFTYIASISLMEKMLGEESEHSRTAIGILVMIRLLPTVLLSPFGGVLADSYDRRKSMILLDMIGACTPTFFIVATFLVGRVDSATTGVAMIYFATVCQECVCALYEPCRTSIIPLLVTGDADLKKATTLAGVAWASIAGLGSALGGFATSYFGARACFCLDGCCYVISAILMYCVGGNFKVAPDTKYESVWQQIKGMTIDGARYLSVSFFGGLVFFKASANLVTGATNVLNVSLSEREEHGSWLLNELDTEQKLGILFSITGIGCILGPLVADPLTDIEQPKALQLACIWGFASVTAGCLGIAIFYPFWAVCIFTAMRSAGSGILQLDSQFLIQKFTAKEMLGRVSALDEALATLAEALSSLVCGILQDKVNLSAEGVSGAQACLGFLFVITWSMYHFTGRGAACRDKELEHFEKPMKKSSYELVDMTIEEPIEVSLNSFRKKSSTDAGPKKRSSPMKPKSLKNIIADFPAPLFPRVHQDNANSSDYKKNSSKQKARSLRKVPCDPPAPNGSLS